MWYFGRAAEGDAACDFVGPEKTSFYQGLMVDVQKKDSNPALTLNLKLITIDSIASN